MCRFIRYCNMYSSTYEILDCLTENVNSGCKDCLCRTVCRLVRKDVCHLCPCGQRSIFTNKSNKQVSRRGQRRCFETCKNCIFSIFKAMKMSKGKGPNETLKSIQKNVYLHCKKCICWAVCLFGMKDICNLC